MGRCRPSIQHGLALAPALTCCLSRMVTRAVPTTAGDQRALGSSRVSGESSFLDRRTAWEFSSIGCNPSEEVGEIFGSSYFRMNPLLFLVDDLLNGERILLAEEKGMGAKSARAIGEKLDEVLDEGAYEAYIAAGKHEH